MQTVEADGDLVANGNCSICIVADHASRKIEETTKGYNGTLDPPGAEHQRADTLYFSPPTGALCRHHQHKMAPDASIRWRVEWQALVGE